MIAIRRTCCINVRPYHGHRLFSSDFPKPLVRIKAFAAKWSEAEIEQVQLMRSRRCSLNDIVSSLPGKSRNSLLYLINIKMKDSFSREVRPQHEYWSQEEVRIISLMRSERKSFQEISSALPNRSLGAIRSYINRKANCGECRTTAPNAIWSVHELARLEQMCRAGKTLVEMTRSLPQKTFNNVRSRVFKGPEQLSKKYPKINRFLPSEDKTLRKLKSGGANWEEIQAALPDRSYRSLTGRWDYIQSNLTKSTSLLRASEDWTPEEDRVLRHLWEVQRLSRNIIANVLDRPGAGVTQRIRSLCGPTLRTKRWKGHLLSQMTSEHAKELADFVKARLLSGEATTTIVEFLDEKFPRLAHVPTRHSQFYTAAEDEKLLRLRSEGCSWSEIAQALPERTQQGLKKRLQRLETHRRLGE